MFDLKKAVSLRDQTFWNEVISIIFITFISDYEIFTNVAMKYDVNFPLRK